MRYQACFNQVVYPAPGLLLVATARIHKPPARMRADRRRVSSLRLAVLLNPAERVETVVTAMVHTKG